MPHGADWRIAANAVCTALAVQLGALCGTFFTRAPCRQNAQVTVSDGEKRPEGYEMVRETCGTGMGGAGSSAILNGSLSAKSETKNGLPIRTRATERQRIQGFDMMDRVD